jgi:LmbE family N-acetylglucosaminyl deacetylase
MEQVAKEVAGLIRKLKPQVVLTFDPFGGYGHPDHIAIQRATEKAFYLAGEQTPLDSLPPYQPQKLYFHTFPNRPLGVLVRLLPIFGVMMILTWLKLPNTTILCMPGSTFGP